jgi:hypothetical protein
MAVESVLRKPLRRRVDAYLLERDSHARPSSARCATAGSLRREIVHLFALSKLACQPKLESVANRRRLEG